MKPCCLYYKEVAYLKNGVYKDNKKQLIAPGKIQSPTQKALWHYQLAPYVMLALQYFIASQLLKHVANLTGFSASQTGVNTGVALSLTEIDEIEF